LVERQLCKLDVRGSNPLASKARRVWRRRLQTRNHFRIPSGSVIPLPPVYARSGSEERRLARRNFSGGGPPFRGAQAARLWMPAARRHNLRIKFVSASRRNQHASRVRYPEGDARNAFKISVGQVLLRPAHHSPPPTSPLLDRS
jgi:hypothetical protein